MEKWIESRHYEPKEYYVVDGRVKEFDSRANFWVWPGLGTPLDTLIITIINGL